ncbi:neprilysin-21-like [Stomoxys calcitrans]|uniref:neprilysin-21-like n=1 Tax=Stomoxys calcitrans TaxID=35570 RepID=UPI0027E38877|nr:neprilysin-21-like [Stomoxys calcitrans]
MVGDIGISSVTCGNIIFKYLISVWMDDSFDEGEAEIRASPFNETEKQIRLSKSEEIRNFLNETGDPCEDFYNFACGNWRAHNKATEDELKKSVLLNVEKQFNLELKAMLESEDFAAKDTIEEKVRDFYKSCLERPTESEVYHSKLKDIIQEFGKMPLLEKDNWVEKDFDWLTTVANIAQKYNHNILLGFKVLPYLRNVSIHGILLTHQEFPFPLPLNANNSEGIYWQRYEENVTHRLLRYFGIDANLAQETAQEIVKFEKVLAQSASHDRYGPDEYRTETSVYKLQRKYSPYMDIEKYMQIAFESIPEDNVIEENESYHYSLIELMAKTPKRIIANYIFYNLIHKFASNDTNCIVETKRHFHNVLENMWYRRHNIAEMERAVSNMFEDLKSVLFIKMRSKAYKWMSLRILRYSLEKVNALSLKVYNYNDTDFQREYGTLNLNSSDYIENLRNIYSLKARQHREKYYQATNDYYDAENMPAGIKYIRTENRLLVPLNVLQAHQFRSTLYPLAVNYGQLGTMLAHSILHAFDDEARFADKYGNEADWWDHPSTVFFDDHTQCFRQQYQRFTYAGLPWPDSIVQSENIADNGGVSMAFQAYVAWYENTSRPQNNLDQEQLPDLKYKNRKLFFIAYAQSLCADIHPDYDFFVLASEYYPPESLRVLASLSNMEEFSHVFKCRPGSVMNPEDKCKVY